jgi:hypothetical protein
MIGMCSTYPEGYIVDASCILQQWICETQLFECLDGLGLHSIGLACRCFVMAIVEDHYCNSEADEITTIALSVSREILELPSLDVRQHQPRWPGAYHNDSSRRIDRANAIAFMISAWRHVAR